MRFLWNDFIEVLNEIVWLSFTVIMALNEQTGSVRYMNRDKHTTSMQ